MQVIRSCAALAAALVLGACLENTSGDVSRLQTDLQPIEAAKPPQGYARLFSPLPHNYRQGFAAAGDPVRLGKASERFELRHGDCGGEDCVEPRSRAEIQMLDAVNTARIGEDIWYGWSFYNATVPAFSKAKSLRLVFGQWTVGGEQRPIFRLIQLGKGEGDFRKCDARFCAETPASRGDVAIQLADISTATRWGDDQNNGYVCRLFDMSAQRGKWIDLTVNTNFSPGSDGYLRVWVDGKLACNYRGQLVSAASARTGNRPEHRRGIFSTWDKRWRTATKDARKPTLIVYYDEFRAGKTRGEVDVQARSATAALD